jgi:hypothetical protein
VSVTRCWVPRRSVTSGGLPPFFRWASTPSLGGIPPVFGWASTPPSGGLPPRLLRLGFHLAFGWASPPSTGGLPPRLLRLGFHPIFRWASTLTSLGGLPPRHRVGFHPVIGWASTPLLGGFPPSPRVGFHPVCFGWASPRLRVGFHPVARWASTLLEWASTVCMCFTFINCGYVYMVCALLPSLRCVPVASIYVRHIASHCNLPRCVATQVLDSYCCMNDGSLPTAGALHW